MGLNAHGDSRKGRTFEVYRAWRVGGGWDETEAAAPYPNNPLSTVPGLRAWEEDRAFLPKLKGKDKTAISDDLPDDKQKRSSDGTIEVVDPGELMGEGKPDVGKYLIDEKAGRGALKAHSIQNYLADLLKYNGTFRDHKDNIYKGIIILADTEEHAKRAVELLAKELATIRADGKQLGDIDKSIHVAYFDDKSENMIFLKQDW